MGGLEWLSCNLYWDDEAPAIAPDLVNPEEVNLLVQGLSTTNTIANYTANGTQYYYLADPGMSRELDFKASTYAVSSTCAPISRKCLPGQTSGWPLISGSQGPGPLYQTYYNFSCSPGFEANMTFTGASQLLDALQADGGYESDGIIAPPSVGMAFSPDAQLSRRVGQYVANFTEFAYDSIAAVHGTYPAGDPLIGSNWSYAYLHPQNPLHFGAWASGFPYVSSNLILEPGYDGEPLLKDPEIFVQNSMLGWILNCSVEVYDVSYAWSNGSMHTFEPSLSSPEMGGFISAPFSFGLGQATITLATIANLAGIQNTSQDLANVFADGWSKAALALSVGALEPKLNDIEQIRNSTITVARVPMVPLYLLLGLKAAYVVAVILLAIGAYCFTHPAETEVVKAQLSAKGLAAAHFDTPGLLQQNVVKEIGDRLQTAKEKGSNEPAPGDVKRAATEPAGPAEKKVGLVATADGAWKFALIADGVWNSIKPMAVSLIDMDAKAGGLGVAGDVINAWKG